MSWEDMDLEKDQWRTFVKTEKKNRVPLKWGKYLD
jgi:hypothetical protein